MQGAGAPVFCNVRCKVRTAAAVLEIGISDMLGAGRAQPDLAAVRSIWLQKQTPALTPLYL